MQQAAKQSVLTIENRAKLSMTGVDSVDAFSESAIQLTVGGVRVQIAGTHLKVLAFSQGTGAFSASGEISSLKYGAEKGRFLRRLLR